MLTPELFEVFLDAFKTNLREGPSLWSSDRDGKLQLSVDDREQIKSLYVRPMVAGYNNVLTSSDDDLIAAFEEQVERLMIQVEDEFIETILGYITFAMENK